MNAVAKSGSAFIEQYLYSKSSVSKVINVEDFPKYQKADIDLVVEMKDDSSYTVEIKVDQHFETTQNYFFETISNDVHNSLGCFLKSEADFFFYLFPQKELHIFALEPAKQWFLKNKDFFKERFVQNQNYKSKGSLVPRKKFISENEVRVIKIL